MHQAHTFILTPHRVPLPELVHEGISYRDVQAKQESFELTEQWNLQSLTSQHEGVGLEGSLQVPSNASADCTVHMAAVVVNPSCSMWRPANSCGRAAIAGVAIQTVLTSTMSRPHLATCNPCQSRGDSGLICVACCCKSSRIENSEIYMQSALALILPPSPPSMSFLPDVMVVMAE